MPEWLQNLFTIWLIFSGLFTVGLLVAYLYVRANGRDWLPPRFALQLATIIIIVMFILGVICGGYDVASRFIKQY